VLPYLGTIELIRPEEFNITFYPDCLNTFRNDCTDAIFSGDQHGVFSEVRSVTKKFVQNQWVHREESETTSANLCFFYPVRINFQHLHNTGAERAFRDFFAEFHYF
jgi:hypothetical protein